VSTGYPFAVVAIATLVEFPGKFVIQLLESWAPLPSMSIDSAVTLTSVPNIVATITAATAGADRLICGRALVLIDRAALVLIRGLVGRRALVLIRGRALPFIDSAALLVSDSAALLFSDGVALLLIGGATLLLINGCALVIIDGCALVIIDSCALPLLDS